MYDVIGKTVTSKTSPIAKGSNLLTLDISSVANGMYMLKAKTNKNVWDNHLKFIK